MDNLTHSLVGLAAAKAGLGRTSRWATATCIIAANLPDADVAALAGGDAFYLEHHRGITHSLVGAFTLALFLPVLIIAVERLYARARGRPPEASFKALLLCSLLLTASHPLLDWTNSYDVRPWLPWDNTWYYGDLVFILDPYIWLTLGGAGFLASHLSKGRAIVWAATALVLSSALLFLPSRVGMSLPTASYVVWFGGLALVVAARLWKRGGRWGASVPATALALIVVYWCALAFFQRRALDAGRAAADASAARNGERVLKFAAMPTPANPNVWLCAAETDAATFRFELSLDEPHETGNLRRLVRVEKPAPEERALLVEAKSNEHVRVLLDFARFPAVRIERNGEGEVVARFADMRYTTPGERGRGGSFSIEVTLSDGR